MNELCFDNNYIRPTPVTIENNMPLPQFSSAQLYHALSGIKRTATGPDGIPFWVWKEHAAIFVIWSLRKEGYNQTEIGHLFNAIVLPKILYALPVYSAHLTMDFSKAFDNVKHHLLAEKLKNSPLTVVQRFLTRCYKRRYTSVQYNIYDLVEKHDAKN